MLVFPGTIAWIPLGATVLVAWVTASLYVILDDRRKELARQRLEIEEGLLKEVELKQDWHLAFLRTLPFRVLSRLWGKLHELTLPVPLRAPLYQGWTWMFNCDLSEMAASSLDVFPNLQSFFIRGLRAGVRPLSDTLLVSPADGRVLHFGPVRENTVEQIKGVSYRLDAFLGIGRYSTSEAERKRSQQPNKESHIKRQLPLREGHSLWHCVIYLAPGDYHRFHSPADWAVEKTKHFAGQLFSVSPAAVRLVRGLFVLNERVVMEGNWQHGYFAMTAVGATNVGSIRIDFDKALKTNRFFRVPYGAYTEKMVYGPPRSPLSSPKLPHRSASVESLRDFPESVEGGETIERPSTPARIKEKVTKWFRAQQQEQQQDQNSAVPEGPQSPDVRGSERPSHLTPVTSGTADDKLPPLPEPLVSPTTGKIGLHLTPGAEVGRFHLGSTVVLIFEAPHDFRFLVRAGDKVKVGEALGERVTRLEEDNDEGNALRSAVNATQRARELRSWHDTNPKTRRTGWLGYIGSKLKNKIKTMPKDNLERETEENASDIDGAISSTEDLNIGKEKNDGSKKSSQSQRVWVSKGGELVGEWLFRDGDPRHLDDDIVASTGDTSDDDDDD